MSIYRKKNEEHDYREAYITYNSNEEEKFNKMYDILCDKGWKLECEEECAGVAVCNKEEYDMFYSDYKQAKGAIKKMPELNFDNIEELYDDGKISLRDVFILIVDQISICIIFYHVIADMEKN